MLFLRKLGGIYVVPTEVQVLVSLGIGLSAVHLPRLVPPEPDPISREGKAHR